jgi:hypothetical protein
MAQDEPLSAIGVQKPVDERQSIRGITRFTKSPKTIHKNMVCRQKWNGKSKLTVYLNVS